MAKRALLIGSPFGGLTGVGNDIEAMAELLSTRGFQTERCCDEKATRDGILEAWRRLVRDAGADDAVGIYYSGHGGLAEAAQAEVRPGEWQPWRYQFIVPTDFDRTTDSEFRGISSPELSRLLRDLTAKTRNVTVILDCCHAARMSRDLDLTPKALPRAQYLGVAAHIERLRAEGLLAGATFNEGNPDAVRVVAAAPTESAYEYTNPHGRRTGVLTEALGIALAAANDYPVSWRTVLLRVRERVLAVVRQQHPDVEGPVNRLLFKLEAVDASGVLGIGLVVGRPVLHGGRIAGVEEGDVYSVMPHGAERADQGAQIADATVLRVRGDTAAVKLSPEHAKVPEEGALAFPVRKALRRWAVRIEGDAPIAGKLRACLDKSAFVREADAKQEAELSLATVKLSGNELVLLDRGGLPLVKPRPADEKAVGDTVVNLDNLARAQHLIALQGGTDAYALDIPVIAELGRVEAGAKAPLADSGETLLVGEKVYVSLRNKGQEKVYAFVFDIGVTGKVTLLTQSSPTGLELPAGKNYTLGQDDYDGTLTGYTLEWPGTAPTEAPRRETLAVVLTSAPQDLRSLETDKMRAVKAGLERKGGGSELERILDQFSFGGSREIRPPTPAVEVRYAVHRLDFMLDPSPLALPDLPPASEWATTDRGYVFDERPDRSLARAAPRGLDSIPGKAAVRLAELFVHRNRALFGSADLRLDCMVVTGTTEGGAPYRVETSRFSSIWDDERLPMDNLLVFHGAVRDFLDIGVWISRDEPGSPTLAELLQKELTSSDFKMAAGVLVELATLGPQGAAVIAGVGAAATLMNISAGLIKAAVGRSIGLYRTSLLAAEGFGVGRHPATGLLRSQDFSFAYEVLAVD